jgi:hypothetical protein
VIAADGNVYDTDRVMFLRACLTQLQRATSVGVPVDGYFLWSAQVLGPTIADACGNSSLSDPSLAPMCVTRPTLLKGRSGCDCCSSISSRAVVVAAAPFHTPM